MYPTIDIASMLVVLCVPGVLLALLLSRCGMWRRLTKGTTVWQRGLALLAFAVIVGYGGDKPGPVAPTGRVLELITVLRDGALKDRSGKVVSGVQARALQQFAGETWQILAATTNAVEQARLDCIDMTNALLSAEYDTVYIGYDFPRGTVAETNHNIMVTFEKVEQTASNLTAMVWFSESPATSVVVRAVYSIAEGQWIGLNPITNHWPATEMVNGVPCVKYCYEIPAGISGIPLKPQYEVEFGGDAPGEYLAVPAEGVTVEVEEDTYLPYTGWDTYGDGEDALQVQYVGGIAVKAIQNGITYQGNNLL